MTTGKKVAGRTDIINSVRTQEQIMNKVREKIPPEKLKTIVGKNSDPFGPSSNSSEKKNNHTEKRTKKIASLGQCS